MNLRIALSATALIIGLLGVLPTAAGAATPARCAPKRSCWDPAVASSFLYSLSKVPTPTRSVPVDVYDIDGFETKPATVRAIHRLKRRAVCYVSAGSWEDWRPDADQVPVELLGEPLDGWEGERWLDIRQIDALAPMLRARIAMCKAKRFDAIEFDNVDGYTQESGFAITRADQLRFNRWLADETHRSGMAVGLKNSPELVPQLVRWFDFAVVEQCFQYNECGRYVPFIKRGKPVYVVEYRRRLASFCPAAKRLKLSAARYLLQLDGRRWACSWPR